MTYPQTTSLARPAGSAKALELEYPQSVGVYAKYEDAQRAVDHLADANFPVNNLAIVGTDLRQYERVLAKRGWGSVIAGGAVSGLFNGLFLALMLWLLQITLTIWTSLAWGLVLGVVFGIITAAVGQMLRGNTDRDFQSITQTFANRYEVLCEHKEAARARELLAQLPGVAAAQLSGTALAPEPAGTYQPAPGTDMPPLGYPAPTSAPTYPAPAPAYPATAPVPPPDPYAQPAPMPTVVGLPGQPDAVFDPRRPDDVGSAAIGDGASAAPDPRA